MFQFSFISTKMDTCPICLISFSEISSDCIKKTCCGHTFCSSCIDEWMIKKWTCPTCRQNLREHSQEEEEEEEQEEEQDYDDDELEIGSDYESVEEEEEEVERIHLVRTRHGMEIKWEIIEFPAPRGYIVIHGTIDEPVHQMFPRSRKVVCAIEARRDHREVGERNWEPSYKDHTLVILDMLRKEKRNRIMDLLNGTNLSVFDNDTLSFDGIRFRVLDIDQAEVNNWVSVPGITVCSFPRSPYIQTASSVNS